MMSFLATPLFLFWLISLPEVEAFFERLDSDKALWDWRLILAVFAWLCHWSYSNYRKVADLKDQEILAIYDDEPALEPQQAEQAEDTNPPPLRS